MISALAAIAGVAMVAAIGVQAGPAKAKTVDVVTPFVSTFSMSGAAEQQAPSLRAIALQQGYANLDGCAQQMIQANAAARAKDVGYNTGQAAANTGGGAASPQPSAIGRDRSASLSASTPATSSEMSSRDVRSTA
jgi:hypothetical protein